MKVFDFTAGRKGKELAEVVRFTGSKGRWIGSKLLKPCDIGHYEFWQPYTGQKVTTPRDFGVEAICFCIGQILGSNDGWMWGYAATEEWLKERGLWKFEEGK